MDVRLPCISFTVVWKVVQVEHGVAKIYYVYQQQLVIRLISCWICFDCVQKQDYSCQQEERDQPRLSVAWNAGCYESTIWV
jgi:hypothetical protein